jgi:hypothetical protein
LALGMSVGTCKAVYLQSLILAKPYTCKALYLPSRILAQA